MKDELIKKLTKIILEMDKLLSHKVIGEDLNINRPEWCHLFCNVTELPIDEMTNCCGIYLDLDVSTIKIMEEVFKDFKFDKE